jgi:FAD:protein FMN transferase
MVTAARPGSRRVEQIMGMPILVDVRDQAVGDRTLDAVFAWFHAVDARFSTYRPGSEIERINRGELALEDAHPDVREVLGRCEELRLETRGYFDVRLASGGRIDPSGLVKGWSVDRAAELLEAAGARNYAVSAGGDIRVLGGGLPEPAWSVGIEHPELPDKIAKALLLDRGAIATSGAYARGAHIVDPHTLRPPQGVLSVTIVGPQLGTADAYATAAFAMGAAGPAWTARLPQGGYEACTILADGRVLCTPALAE